MDAAVGIVLRRRAGGRRVRVDSLGGVGGLRGRHGQRGRCDGSHGGVDDAGLGGSGRGRVSGGGGVEVGRVEVVRSAGGGEGAGRGCDIIVIARLAGGRAGGCGSGCVAVGVDVSRGGGDGWVVGRAGNGRCSSRDDNGRGVTVRILGVYRGCSRGSLTGSSVAGNSRCGSRDDNGGGVAVRVDGIDSSRVGSSARHAISCVAGNGGCGSGDDNGRSVTVRVRVGLLRDGRGARDAVGHGSSVGVHVAIRGGSSHRCLATVRVISGSHVDGDIDSCGGDVDTSGWAVQGKADCRSRGRRRSGS